MATKKATETKTEKKAAPAKKAAAPTKKAAAPAVKAAPAKKAAAPAVKAAPAKKAAAPAVKAAPAKKAAVPAVKAAPAAKKAAKAPELIIESALGGKITPAEILKKVGKADQVYVRVDQNKAYWVRGDESGDVDLW